MCAHKQILAKLCYDYKQHFAHGCVETWRMSKKPINDVLAENLTAFMEERNLTQAALGKLADIGQTTVGLYLNPHRRSPGKTGKPPSAKLSEVEALANALDVEVWEMLRPLTISQRDAYKKIEAAFNSLMEASGNDTKSHDEPKRANQA